MSAPRALALIYNPAAGDGRWRPSIEAVRRGLEEAGGAVELLPTREAGHGVELGLRAARSFKTIAVYGGDGTLNEVLNGVVTLPQEQRPEILMLPGGTMNVLCRDLGIPLNAVEAAGVFKTGVRKRIYLGLATTANSKRYFSLMAGAGLDAAVIHGMSDFVRAKRLLGPFSFGLAGMALTSSHRFPAVEVTVEDGPQADVYKGYEVVVGKSRGYGGWFSITDQADPGQPMFEVAIGQSPGVLAHTIHLARAFLGWLKSSDGHVFVKTTRLRMTSLEPVLVQMDGEAAGELPMEFSVDGTSIEMLAPPA